MITAKFRTPRESLLKNKAIQVDDKLVDNLITLVCEVCNVEEKVIRRKNRHRELVLARNLCFFILHVHYKQKSAKIATYFNRDRTTILHGINTFVNDVEVVPFYMERYMEVRSKIKIPKLYTDKN